VVVSPDADDDTTIVEERDDVEIDTDPAMPAPDTGTDVNVDVGGEKGVDVDVNKNSDATDPN
jgi:hypothetical protein